MTDYTVHKMSWRNSFHSYSYPLKFFHKLKCILLGFSVREQHRVVHREVKVAQKSKVLKRMPCIFVQTTSPSDLLINSPLEHLDI